jgi:hypothetical protein
MLVRRVAVIGSGVIFFYDAGITTAFMLAGFVFAFLHHRAGLATAIMLVLHGAMIGFRVVLFHGAGIAFAAARLCTARFRFFIVCILSEARTAQCQTYPEQQGRENSSQAFHFNCSYLEKTCLVSSC